MRLLVPYLYLFLAGHAEMPGYAIACLGAFVTVLATASVLRVRHHCLAVGLDSALAFEDL